MFYSLKGEIKDREELSDDAIAKCNRMKVRCWLKDNLQRVGFADVFRTHDDNEYDDMIKNYIFLWLSIIWMRIIINWREMPILNMIKHLLRFI